MLTLVSQTALVSLLKEATVLNNVVDQFETEQWANLTTHMAPTFNLLPALENRKLWAPLSSGYIHIEHDAIRRWSTLLKRSPGKRLIALHWQGNPGHEPNLLTRTCSPSSNFWPFASSRTWSSYPYKKGQEAEQLENNNGLNFVEGQKGCEPVFGVQRHSSSTANCEALIGPDSAVVHLAGAMGIPTWVALRWIPEWRWGLKWRPNTLV